MTKFRCVLFLNFFPNFPSRYYNVGNIQRWGVRDWVIITSGSFKCYLCDIAVVVYIPWSFNSWCRAGAVGGRRDGLPMAPLLLFNSTTAYLVLAATTNAKLFPGKCSFCSRTSMYLSCALLTHHECLGCEKHEDIAKWTWHLTDTKSKGKERQHILW